MTKPLRLSHRGPNLGFGWMLPWHRWPQSPLLCWDPHALQTQEGSTARVLGHCGTSCYKHHHAPEHARGTLDPNTAQAATGTFLKVLKAVLGVGQEQLELRSLRKAEHRDISCGFFPLPIGVTSVSFHVLIYSFNCALTRDLIMPREQLHKFEHVFPLSTDLLIISELLSSFPAVPTTQLETLASACCSLGRSKPAVDTAWPFKKYALGLAALSVAVEGLMTESPLPADPAAWAWHAADAEALLPSGIRHPWLEGI